MPRPNPLSVGLIARPSGLSIQRHSRSCVVKINLAEKLQYLQIIFYDWLALTPQVHIMATMRGVSMPANVELITPAQIPIQYTFPLWPMYDAQYLLI
jgi:hypothetical protein